MSRFTTFTDFKNQQADDTTEILDQIGISVSVYRQQSPAGVPGFTTELPAHTFYKNILAAMQSRGNPRELSSDGGRGSEVSYIAITSDNDIRIGDVWKVKGIEYDVKFFDPTNVGKIEVELEVKI